MKEILIEQAAQIIGTLVIMLIGVLGTWLSTKLNKYMQLKNLTGALETCLNMTKVTVGELQQIFVEGMKEANEDGKLTEEEIKSLNASLIARTKSKLAPEIINVIVSAGIDINQFILESGEHFVQEHKYE